MGLFSFIPAKGRMPAASSHDEDLEVGCTREIEGDMLMCSGEKEQWAR